MQGPLVQIAIHRGRKEDHRGALARGYLEVHGREIGLSALGAVVEIHQNGLISKLAKGAKKKKKWPVSKFLHGVAD